jgi:uracil phosphoribosyltransferase
MLAPRLAGKKLVFAPILRAGTGLLDGMLDLVPSARVAHIGLYRDPASLVAVEYYFKAPEDVAERLVIVIDPMLATANTAVAAVDRLKERGATNLRLVCLVAAPEGVERFRAHHDDVHIWTAALDERLNEHGYIVPGTGRRGRPAVRHPLTGRRRSAALRTGRRRGWPAPPPPRSAGSAARPA